MCFSQGFRCTRHGVLLVHWTGRGTTANPDSHNVAFAYFAQTFNASTIVCLPLFIPLEYSNRVKRRIGRMKLCLAFNIRTHLYGNKLAIQCEWHTEFSLIVRKAATTLFNIGHVASKVSITFPLSINHSIFASRSQLGNQCAPTLTHNLSV